MKKFMFLVISLLIVSTVCFALESGPSNKVGYVKITAVGGGVGGSYTAFGLPFVFWYVPTGNVPTYGTESRKPSSICGNQPACGTFLTADRIVQQGGSFAYRLSPSCTWAGTLETGGTALMAPGWAYWYQNKTGTNRNFVLAGEADTSATGIPAIAIAGPAAPGGSFYTPYSWRDPRQVARDKLNLVQQGFTGGSFTSSDRVVEQGGNFFYCSTANPPVWAGALASVTPGKAYWIQNKQFGHAWTYQYMANGNPIIALDPDRPAVIEKLNAPAKLAPRAGAASK